MRSIMNFEGNSTTSERESRRREEETDPRIIDRWARVIPRVVGTGVGLLSHSHIAGGAAQVATGAALETNPKLRKLTDTVARDAAHELGPDLAGAAASVLLMPVVLVALPVALLLCLHKK